MELMAAIAIVAILTVLTLPSFAALSKAGRFSSAVGEVSETLDLARQLAVARNTYVWVAFTVPASPTDPPLGTLVLASTDGTNPLPSDWSTSVSLPDSRFLLVAKRASYAQCQFLDAGALTTKQIPSLPAPAGADANALASNLSFTMTTPTGLTTFNRVIEYTPSGLAYNGPNSVAFVEFGLQPRPVPNGPTIGHDVACIRVPFITGRTLLYRP